MAYFAAITARVADDAAEPIPLDRLIQLYVDRADVMADTRAAASRIWQHFTDSTGAQTLDDLTTESLVRYREVVREKARSVS